ncbi:MAG: lipocalin-like domain-containing protein [Candidatus Hermodarchaeota archaeon]
MKKNTKVIEGWTGPGRCDAQIEPLLLSEDVLHIDMNKRGMYEWWYFDAHLDSGHILVVFFHASNPNPGLQGKTGVEIVLLRPDGKRVQKFISYRKSDFIAARDKPEVTIGKNTLRVEKRNDGLPVYEIDVKEKELGCRLSYRAEVNGWKPGTGLSRFGDLGSFSWIIPFARATVEGTITDGDKTIQVSGIGYHDHNWLDFPFQSIINYWMWGRIYSENFTVSYAYIQCNKKVNNHQVKVLMLADGQEVILSTGEFDFHQDDFSYNPKAKHQFPGQITINAPEKLDVVLKVTNVLEAQDMLENFNPILRFLAKNIIRIKPGYFRLVSDFELEVTRDGKTVKETGTTLHEIVIMKPIQEEPV